jgi:2'-5' RNA ligase
MIRLFVALSPPPAVRARLLALQGGVPGAKWAQEDNLHLTLRFIGEVDEPAFADIAEALGEVEAPAFTLQLAGVGQFGDRKRAYALWAGVRASEPLALLRGRIETALSRAGVPRDDRKFLPHVTLARLKDAKADRVAAFLAEHGLFESRPFEVASFALFSSQLRHTHALHQAEAEYPLLQAGEAR